MSFVRTITQRHLNRNKIYALRLVVLMLVMVLLGTFGLAMRYHGSAEAAGELTITFPESVVSAEPTVATRTIIDDDINFTIPYIQTEKTLTPTATVDASKVPAGGGLKFVLDEGLAGEAVQYDVSGPSPYSVTFDNLTKAEHTLDVYVVNSSQIVQSGVDKHDGLTRIGVGDIIGALGDSITAGFPGDAVGLDPVTNWTEADPGDVSDDGRNFPQQDSNDGLFHTGSLVRLNNQLTVSHGYPVFIMNEGVGGIDAGETAYNITPGSPIPLSTKISRLQDLKPNKWIIHLGVNDVRAEWPANQFKDRIGWIAEALITHYDASAEDIFIAKPLAIQAAWSPESHTAEAAYLPELDSLISSEGYMYGPDFFNVFTDNDPAYYAFGTGQPYYHPSPTGYSAMADLQTLTFAKPVSVDVAFDAGNYDVSWDSLSAKHSEVMGYEVRYGTGPGDYQTVDVGTDLNYSITNLSNSFQGKKLKVFVRATYDNSVNEYIAKSDWSDVSEIWVDGTPSQPRNVSVITVSKQATVSFDPPESDGNHTITGYTVTVSPGGATFSGSSSPIVVTGLTNGTDYSFTVSASNSEGTGPESDSVDASTPPVATDLEVGIQLDEPKIVEVGSLISYTVTINNNGYDDIDLSTFHDPNSSLVSVFVSGSDLSYVDIIGENVLCAADGLIGVGPYAAYFPNHLEYYPIGCVFTGGSTILPMGETFSFQLQFEVLDTVSSSFTTYALNTNVINDPDMPAINSIFGNGPDFLDGFIASDLNNFASYTYPEAEAVDANGDGIDDGTQPYIASYTNDATQRLVAIELTPSCTLSSSGLQQEEVLSVQDPAYSYPNGLLGFSATCSDSSILVTQYYYDVTGDWVVRKHNPNNQSFFDITGGVIDHIEIDGHQVTRVRYEVADNGALDLNPATGTIADPAGIAVLQLSAPATGVGHE